MEVYRQTIKELMKAKGLSMEQFCKEIEVSPSFINNYYRNGKAKADLPNMVIVALQYKLEASREELAQIPQVEANPAEPESKPDTDQITLILNTIKANTNVNHDELMRAIVKLTEAVEKLQKGIHTDMVTIQSLVKPAPLATAYGKVLK